MASKVQRSLEERVTTLENYFRVGITVCVILGVSGGYLGKLVSDALSRASSARSTAEAAENTADEAQNTADEAVKKVGQLAETAVKAEVVKQVPQGIDSRFDELARSLHVSFGSEDFVDYAVLGDKNIEHKCKEGQVVTQWIYGGLHKDVALKCRPLDVVRTK